MAGLKTTKALSKLSKGDIGEVKAMIEAKGGAPAARQRLVYNDVPQDIAATLQAVGVEDGATIHLIMMEGDADAGQEPKPEPEPEMETGTEPAKKGPETLVPNVPAASAEAAPEGL